MTTMRPNDYDPVHRKWQRKHGGVIHYRTVKQLRADYPDICGVSGDDQTDTADAWEQYYVWSSGESDAAIADYAEWESAQSTNDDGPTSIVEQLIAPYVDQYIAEQYAGKTAKRHRRAITKFVEYLSHGIQAIGETRVDDFANDLTLGVVEIDGKQHIKRVRELNTGDNDTLDKSRQFVRWLLNRLQTP